MADERQVVVVTGATRGTGYGIALDYAERGDAVVLVGRSTKDQPSRVFPQTLEEIDAAAREASAGGVLSIRADISRPEDCRRVVDETLAAFGRCDVLVNNAGYAVQAPFLDISPSKWSAVAGVNVLGPVWLTYGFLPGMLERGHGSIVGISSISAHSEGGARNQLPYAVMKLALEKFTTGLALQLEGTGVAISCVIIDEVVATPAVTHLQPHMYEQGISVDAFAPSVLWMADQGVAVNGKVYGFEELRAVGGMTAPQIASLYR